jgi:hypothetical protein
MIQLIVTQFGMHVLRVLQVLSIMKLVALKIAMVVLVDHVMVMLFHLQVLNAVGLLRTF